MKKRGILNSQLSKVIAAMGHTDRLVVCDCGLPIPHHAQLIDLALTQNIPRFIDTLTIILDELQIEGAIIAEEMATVSPAIYQALKTILPEIPIDMVSHEKFKSMTQNENHPVFVRTGEATPYANIILISGVTF